MSTRKRKVHGYKGHSSIDVAQRIPKSVVNYIIKSTPNLQSNRGASVSKNSSFIDGFFNSRSREETFRIGDKKKSWVNPGLQHVRMVNVSGNASSLSGYKIDSDMFGLKFFKRNRFHNKSKSFKWRLKNSKKHHQFINECLRNAQNTLTIKSVIPLHKLWCKYANDVMVINKCTSNDERKKKLMKVNASHFNDKISKLDIHGCLVKIMQCKARKVYENYEGVVVMVSKNRMGIVTSLPHKNKLVCIPFKGTTFTFELCQRIVTIYGDHYRQFIP